MTMRSSLVFPAIAFFLSLFLGLTDVFAAEAKDAKQEMLVFLSRQVYVASFQNKAVDIKRISPKGKYVEELLVHTSGKIIWTLGSCKPKGPISYCGFQVDFIGRRVPDWRSDVVLSPDGKTLAYVGYEKGCGLSLYCEDINTGKIRMLSSNWRFLEMPAWSPDGKKIAYYCTKDPKFDKVGHPNGVCLNVVDIATGKDIQVAPPSHRISSVTCGEERVYPPVWSKKGDRLSFKADYEKKHAHPKRYSGHTYEVPAEGGKKPVLLTKDRKYAFCASRKDDVVYVAEKKGIYAVTLDANEAPLKKVLLIKGRFLRPKISPSGKMLAYISNKDPYYELHVRFLKEDVVLVVHKMEHRWTSPDCYYWVMVDKPAAPPKKKTNKNK